MTTSCLDESSELFCVALTAATNGEVIDGVASPLVMDDDSRYKVGGPVFGGRGVEL